MGKHNGKHGKDWPDVLQFIQAGGITLRRYQEKVALAIIDAALNRRGLSFAVMFPRQSGKNEMQAQIEAYLLWALQDQGAEIIKVSPTWRPQAMNAMRRLEQVFMRNPHTENAYERERGFILRIGQARITFLSGAPGSNIVGATASTLLEVDEAQAVEQDKFDRDILPMAASTNATRVFWGTAWNGKTLLSRELRSAREAEAASSLILPAAKPAGRHVGKLAGKPYTQLAFCVDAEVVAAEVPAYRAFVDAQVARLGRDHPMIRTQYFSEEVNGAMGMFSLEDIALMKGSHPAQDGPSVGKIYALLLDIGGEDKNAQQLPLFDLQMEDLANPARDATALTVVEVDLSTRSDPLIRAPTFRVVQRKLWLGVLHERLYGELSAVMNHWKGQRLVVDATGLGTGVASFLQTAFHEKVIRFTFTSKSKSELGWKFRAAVKTGRWQEPVCGKGSEQERWQQRFYQELSHCQMRLSSGPEQTAHWGVTDGSRDAQTGELVHDDLVISAALCAELERIDWAAPSSGVAFMIPGKDPLDEVKGY